MLKPAPAKQGSSRDRSDGRRPLLVYMEPDLVKNLKKIALDEDRTAYEIVEEAVKDWMDARARKNAKKIAK